MHKTKCSLFFFQMGITPGLCDTYFLKSAGLLCKQKSLQESKDKSKDLPVLEILPTTPSYKCILQPSSKHKRNIFLEVLAADSFKWTISLLGCRPVCSFEGPHELISLLLSGMSNFLFHAFIPLSILIMLPVSTILFWKLLG